MKKTNLSVFALVLAVLLLLPLLSSCDFLQNLFHIHTYRYFYDGANHWMICDDCNNKTVDEAHDFLSKESVDATCEHVGYNTFECSVCGYVKTDFTPQQAHDFQSVENSDVRECSNCHKRESALTEISDTEKYGYTYLSSLSDGEKYLSVYEKISAAVAARSDKAFVFENLTEKELAVIVHCVCSDHPEYFWVDSGYDYTYSGDQVYDVSFSYSVSEEELPFAKENFNREIDKILAGVSADMTEFEKELYVHDAIVKMNTYDETQNAPMTHSAYGAAVLRRSVCDGYTKLFQCLLARCGVLSVSLSGYSGENHSWNAARIDGDWYMVDVTWDDPVGQKPGEVSYVYFNCSGEQLSFDHSFETPDGEKIENYFDIPECTSDAYNYFEYFGYKGRLTTEDIERVILMQLQNGQTDSFQIRIVGSDGTPDEKNAAVRFYIENDNEFYIMLGRIFGKTSSSMRFSYSTSSDGNILKLSVN